MVLKDARWANWFTPLEVRTEKNFDAKNHQKALDYFRRCEGILMFTKELNFFIANQDELLKKYHGRVLVIKNESVLGVYNNPLEAYLSTQKEHKIGTFVIQPCLPGPDAYSITISSNNVIMD